MDHKPNEAKKFRNTMIAMIVLVALGLLMLITGGNRLMSKIAYSRSKDVRKVTAYVEDYEYISDSDDDDYETYKVKVSYVVDGKTYKGKDTLYHDTYIGEEITEEVYLTSQGDYKLRGDSDPFTFLFACILIPVGVLFIFIGLWCIKDLFENKNSR